MKLVASFALALFFAAPVLAGETKQVHILPTVSTQSTVLMGTLSTQQTASVGTLVTVAAAQAVESTGHTK